MVNLVVQIVDFLVKAVLDYAKSPAGQKEFQDIWDAAKSAGVDVEGAWSQMTAQQPTEMRQGTPSGSTPNSSEIYGTTANQVRSSKAGG